MGTRTVDWALRALEMADGAPLHPDDYQRANGHTVTLYDPPVRGETPVDGAGNSRTSEVNAARIHEAFAKGFTVEPVTIAAPSRKAKR